MYKTMRMLGNMRCSVSDGRFHAHPQRELIWKAANLAQGSFSSFVLVQKLCLLNKNILDPNLGAISRFSGVRSKKVKKRIVAVFHSVAPVKMKKKLQCQRSECKKVCAIWWSSCSFAFRLAIVGLGRWTDSSASRSAGLQLVMKQQR